MSDKSSFTVNIYDTQKDWLRAEAKRSGLSLNEVARRIIRAGIQAHIKKGDK